MDAEYPEKNTLKTQHSTDRRSPGPVSGCPAKVHHARTELARLSRRPQSEDQKPGIMSQNRFQKTSIHFTLHRWNFFILIIHIYVAANVQSQLMYT